MKRYARPVLALAALLIAGATIVAASWDGDHGWPVQAEHLIVVRNQVGPPAAGRVEEYRSTIRLWYWPGIGSRMDVDTESGPGGPRQRRIISDGVTFWTYDPSTNRYTEVRGGAVPTDPRGALGATMSMAGTADLAAAMTALRSLPGVSVSDEGMATVAGRRARVVTTAPFGCETSVTASPSGGTTALETRCSGSTRLWLDAATGWLLQARGDDGAGGGYAWDTHAVRFGVPLSASQFHFIPPPGAVRVERLED